MINEGNNAGQSNRITHGNAALQNAQHCRRSGSDRALNKQLQNANDLFDRRQTYTTSILGKGQFSLWACNQGMESCEETFRQLLNLLGWARLHLCRQFCPGEAVWGVKHDEEGQGASLGARGHLPERLPRFH